MEIREFAERVLFASSLEEKLQSPKILTDDNPGSAIITPNAPGRPTELRFKSQSSAKADFPDIHRLHRIEDCGRLLHFFANHELLATELMALVLLRFPEAPTAFRRGVIRTLKDEQRHTCLYVQRMRECGVHFGDLPVSGYFWRTVSTMENPIDYVASLCLTFEQANLDFCRHFAQSFQAAGDNATFDLLEGIYKDEIGHVAYGLKWFRRWKNPDESDWEAFCRHLKFPLSPSRAKGFTLNVEGRRAAGFDPSFIAELNVYSQSKGRTPGVFIFNPFAEGFIAHGKSFTPVKYQQQLACDLENLPQFLCRQDDIVLVSRRPSAAYLSNVHQAGFALPEFIEVPQVHLNCRPNPGLNRRSPLLSLSQRKLDKLRPWAWGPDSLELLAPLFPGVTGEKRTPDQCFNAQIAQLYSKNWSARLLRKLLISLKPDCSWLCTEAEVGVAANTLEGALAAVAAIRRNGHHRIIIKEALGLAGHNSIRLWEPEILDTQRRWIARAVEKRREVIIEPWLDRELDFSVQLEMKHDGLRLCGYSGLVTDRKGQFQANWAAPNYSRRLPARVTALFSQPRDISARIHQLYERFFSLLESNLEPSGYLGPVSIDAFVYRVADGECRLKPIVEINPRYTMGRLMVDLMKYAAPGSFGDFRLFNLSSIRSQRSQDFVSFARLITERHPLLLQGQPVPKIREGTLCLNDPAQAQVCLAVFQVARCFDDLKILEDL